MQCTTRSGLQLTGGVLLLAAIVLAAIALGTSYWTVVDADAVAALTSLNANRLLPGRYGLFERCSKVLVTGTEHCNNRFEKFIEDRNIANIHETFEPYEIAIIGLMGLSILIGLLALIFAPCCGSRCALCLANTVLLAALCITAAVATYAYYQMTDDRRNDVKFFSWSFWTAVTAAGVMFLTLPFFCIAGCLQRRGDYERQI